MSGFVSGVACALPPWRRALLLAYPPPRPHISLLYLLPSPLLQTCNHPTAPSLSPVPASQAQAHKSSSCTCGPNEAVPILQCVRSRLDLPEIKRELADQPPCLCLLTSLPPTFPSSSLLPMFQSSCSSYNYSVLRLQLQL